MIPRHLYIAISVLLLAVLGMSLYAWRMRGRAAAGPAVSIDSRPVGPPVAGATEQVTLFVAYDDTGVLLAQSAHIPLPSVRQQRAEELLRSLLALYLDKASPHPLPPGRISAVFTSSIPDSPLSTSTPLSPMATVRAYSLKNSPWHR